jgi:hypothetical protein
LWRFHARLERVFSFSGNCTSEPITGSAAGVAGWKLIGGLVGAKLVPIVVMCMTRPRSDSEWAVALISTGAGSIYGCAAVVMTFRLKSWMQE